MNFRSISVFVMTIAFYLFSCPMLASDVVRVEEFRAAIQKSLPDQWAKVLCREWKSSLRMGLHFHSLDPQKVHKNRMAGELRPSIHVYLRPKAEHATYKKFLSSVGRQDSISRHLGDTEDFVVWVGFAYMDEDLLKPLLKNLQEANTRLKHNKGREQGSGK
ncbi:hypothetical protein BVY04_05470 [bacterium M21]|nr:hypothetical protein BVY04_05470 [bacterium M21]